MYVNLASPLTTPFDDQMAQMFDLLSFLLEEVIRTSSNFLPDRRVPYQLHRHQYNDSIDDNFTVLFLASFTGF